MLYTCTTVSVVPAAHTAPHALSATLVKWHRMSAIRTGVVVYTRCQPLAPVAAATGGAQGATAEL
jgi:hypothetical protein